MTENNKITRLDELQTELDRLNKRSELKLSSSFEEKYRRSLIEDIRVLGHQLIKLGYDPILIRNMDSLLSL